MIKYNTSFKNVGAAYEETLVLFQEFYKRGSWSAVTKAAFEENLLKKKSTKWIRMLLQSVERRYFENHPQLPDGKMLTNFLNAINSNQARIQTLYQYICESHPLVDKLIIDLVGENLKKYTTFLLKRTFFENFLLEVAKEHPEIDEWAYYTKEKWRRDFYAFLRNTGIMEKHPSVLVRKFILRPETFAFFLYGLIEKRLTPSEILNSYLWKRCFLTISEIEDKLSECQVRGWLQYRSIGEIIELIPNFSSLEEFIGAVK